MQSCSENCLLKPERSSLADVGSSGQRDKFSRREEKNEQFGIGNRQSTTQTFALALLLSYPQQLPHIQKPDLFVFISYKLVPDTIVSPALTFEFIRT